MAAVEPALSFEERYDSIVREIEKRRRGWTLVSVDFDDVKQIILIHVAKQLRLYDPRKGQFTHWLNGLISNQIRNELRNNYTKHARPCIQGCPFNTGGETCSQTTSGKQCGECKVYATWEKRKLAHHNVRQTLPLENHVQEVHNLKGDFVDIAASKKVIDRVIMGKLNKHERRLYRLLYINGKSEEEVGKMLKYRKTGKMHSGYLIFLRLRHKVVAMARDAIANEGLA